MGGSHRGLATSPRPRSVSRREPFRLARTEEDGVTGLLSDLRRIPERGESVLKTLPDRLRALLDCEIAATYEIDSALEGTRPGIQAVSGPGAHRLKALAATYIGGGAALGYDPMRPAAPQRNVPLTTEEVFALSTSGRDTVRNIYPKLGLGGLDQLRVLVCEGPTLLAWVGGYRPDPFGERERELLRRIVPALRSRLVVEQQLGRASVLSAALEAALGAVPAEAYVVRFDDRNVRILEANAAGVALLDEDRRATMDELVAAMRGDEQGAYSVTTFAANGLPEYALAIRRQPRNGIESRLGDACRRWGLTPRHRDVLSQLARGRPNKLISAELGCAEATVELHVTAILRRVGVQSRAELIAKFWTE